MRCVSTRALWLALATALVSMDFQPAVAQSREDVNGCIATRDNPCMRTGSCNIQGSTWGQRVTTDRADTFDTMGWAGLCDMVHVALVQGNCSPPGADRDITVALSATSYAVVDSISGPLRCEATTTDVAGGSSRAAVRLSGFPSPTSSVTTIRFQLPRAENINLSIYNVAGRLLRTLVAGPVNAGESRAVWDGRDDAGRRAPPGIYVASLRAGRLGASQRVVMLR